MSEERKAKAAARRAARKQNKSERVEQNPLIATEPELNIDYTIEKPAELGEPTINGGTLDAATVTAANDNQPSPIVRKAFVQNPTGIATNRPVGAKLPSIDKLAASMPNGESEMPATDTVPEEKPQTWEEMLAGLRTSAETEKTDSAKMQKYYALTDALEAIGKMGATAIGGAIGGNALDSASKVAEYKPSRGYLDAIEKAKKANDRLRALDEKEFTLAYNKELRDDERAYKEKIAEGERKFRAEQAELERKWKTANAEEKAKIEKEILASKQEQERWLKEQSLEYARIMMGGKGTGTGKGKSGKEIPLRFTNGMAITVPKEYYDDMMDSFYGMDFNGVPVDEDNVKQFMRANPEVVNDYLSSFGMGFLKASDTTESETQPEDATPETVEKMPKRSFWSRLGETLKNPQDIGGPAAGYVSSKLRTSEGEENTDNTEVVKKDGQYYIHKYGVT